MDLVGGDDVEGPWLGDGQVGQEIVFTGAPRSRM